MVCVVESWTDEVAHTSINDCELLDVTLLDVEHTGDERTHLTNYCATKLEVKMLIISKLNAVSVSLEISLEVWNRSTVRVVVVNTKTTAHVDVLNADALLCKTLKKLVYTTAESLEVTHFKNLTSDVEMEADELNVRQFLCLTNCKFHVLHCDAKLILSKTSSDVCVCMSTYVWVDAEANTSHLAFLASQFVDDLQLWL